MIALPRTALAAGPLDVRRRLLAFVGVAILVLAVIALGTVVFARVIAQQEALRDAEQTTARLAELVAAPLLAGMLAGDAESRDELDRAVEFRLRDGSVSEITIWRGDGTVVYSHESGAIGRRFPPSQGVIAAVERDQVTSGIDLADEAGGLPSGERFIDVYVPLKMAGTPTMAFEAYYSTQRVDERAAALALQLILLALVPLVVLQLVQIPIAVSLAQRVGRQEAERAALLERVLSASDRERRAIAADLHDGVVEDLAKVGQALGALTAVLPPERRRIADSCAASVRSAVDTLRRLMVDIYPPDLTGSGLSAAIEGLAQPLRDAGAEVSVEAAPLPSMAPDIAAALYRVARETLTNVAKHAQATTVRIELGPVPDPAARPAHDSAGRGCDAVRLRVTDDGVGFPGDAPADRRSDGHLGLHMLNDRVADLGGRFTVTPGPGAGTVAEAVIPLGVDR